MENKFNDSIEVRKKKSLLDKRKQQLKLKITPAESFFKEKMKELKINTKFQKGLIAGDQFMIADFYIPKLRLIVEIDGEYHSTHKQQLRDGYKDAYYAQRGFNVLRIKNSDVEYFDYQTLKNAYIKGFATDELKMIIGFQFNKFVKN